METLLEKFRLVDENPREVPLSGGDILKKLVIKSEDVENDSMEFLQRELIV